MGLYTFFMEDFLQTLPNPLILELSLVTGNNPCSTNSCNFSTICRIYVILKLRKAALQGFRIRKNYRYHINRQLNGYGYKKNVNNKAKVPVLKDKVFK